MATAERLGTFARTHWPLGVVIAVALLLRWSNLAPIFFYGDDAEYVTVAQSLEGDPRALAYPDLEGFGSFPFVSQPPLMLYIFALAGKLVGNAEVGAVLVSTLLGAATCGVVYAIGVLLQNRTTGTIAGLVLAVLPSHVTLSRKAMLDAGFTFFFTLSVLCFLLWMRHRTTRSAVLTGCAIAATLFSKLPGVLVLAPLAAGFAYAMWERGRPVAAATSPSRLHANVERRNDLRQAIWATVPVVALATLYLFLLWHLRASRDLWTKLGWQLGRVSNNEGVSSRESRPWHWYLSDGGQGILPQFGVLVVLLAVVGTGVAVWWIVRRPHLRGPSIVLLAWPLTILLFFTLSQRKEWFYVLPAAPAFAILAALPFGPDVSARVTALLGRARETRWHRSTPTAFALAIALVLLVIPTGVVATRDIVLRERSYGYGVEEAARWIHEQDPEAGQVGTLLGRFTLKFYNDHVTYHWYVPHAFVESEIEAGRVRYLVWDYYLNLTYEQEWFDDLVTRYDGTVMQEYESSGGRVRVRVYELGPR